MFLYAALSFVLLVFVILCVPETKGRSLEEISKELAKKYAAVHSFSQLTAYLANWWWNWFLRFISFLRLTRKNLEVPLFRQEQPQESLINRSTHQETSDSFKAIHLLRPERKEKWSVVHPCSVCWITSFSSFWERNMFRKGHNFLNQIGSGFTVLSFFFLNFLKIWSKTKWGKNWPISRQSKPKSTKNNWMQSLN